MILFLFIFLESSKKQQLFAKIEFWRLLVFPGTCYNKNQRTEKSDDMERLSRWSKKKISLEELEALYQPEDYLALVALVTEAVQGKRLYPVNNSRTNGKRPALAQQYWVRAADNDWSALEQELRYDLHPALQNDYYLQHLEQYQADRAAVMAVNQFWHTHTAALQQAVSMNERSFQIWQKEKFLQEGAGKRILKNLGVSLEVLHIYQTTEPLAYYAHSKAVPQNILIVENKDTFYSMRRHLLAGNQTILQLAVGTLIYGAGKKIQSMMTDFAFCTEPYLNAAGNQFYYFGDLDYEGIAIYEGLREKMQGIGVLQVFTAAYRAMLGKVDVERLPDTKAGQQPTAQENFWQPFHCRSRRRFGRF